MLKDNFFSIVKFSTINTNKASIEIKLNPDHAIFQGHFPNRPITPGVCILQIAKELFSSVKVNNYIINKIKNVKFINPIDPNVNSNINYDLDWEESSDGLSYQIKTVAYFEGTTFCKANMQLIINK